MKNTGLLVLVLSFLLSTNSQADDATQDSHWYSGFSITPGFGFRHLGFDVTRKSDGYTGNISNAGFAQSVFTLNMTTPSIKLNRGGEWQVEIQSYTALVELDHQFYNDGGTLPTGGDSGNRVDVGTSIDGYYSYLLPTIKFELGREQKFGASLGVGYWTSSFNGDIILSPNDQPNSSMPKTLINLDRRKELAYIFTLSWTTKNNWVFRMTVGGTNFSDDVYDYKTEEVAMILGKQFVF